MSHVMRDCAKPGNFVVRADRIGQFPLLALEHPHFGSLPMTIRPFWKAGAALTPIVLVCLAQPVLAQDDDAATRAGNPADTIIVTGTRRTDRTVAESAVPIDVISSDALLNQGLTETNRLLNYLVPSFNFPLPSLTDGTDSLRPATLRGLAPDQVLVLVNGKRRHTSALLNINGSVGRGSVGVDMNTIPPLAIERIEVLRDGASSQFPRNMARTRSPA
jgi:iron complex outermembrane receptor protein